MPFTIRGLIDKLEELIAVLARIAAAVEKIASNPQPVAAGTNVINVEAPGVAAEESKMHANYPFPIWVDGHLTVVIEAAEEVYLKIPVNSDTGDPLVIEETVANIPLGTIILAYMPWDEKHDGAKLHYKYIGIVGSTEHKGAYIHPDQVWKLSG